MLSFFTNFGTEENDEKDIEMQKEKLNHVEKINLFFFHF